MLPVTDHAARERAHYTSTMPATRRRPLPPERVLAGAIDTVRAAAHAVPRSGPITVEIYAEARAVLSALLDEHILAVVVPLIERHGPHSRIGLYPRMTEGPMGIGELLEEDHHRLWALESRVETLAREGHVDTVLVATLLAEGLRRHVAIEEELVIPAYRDQGGPGVDAAAAFVHREHELIRAQVDLVVEHARKRIGGEVPRETWASELLRALHFLRAIEAEHTKREERALFPKLDRHLSADAKRALLHRIVLF